MAAQKKVCATFNARGKVRKEYVSINLIKMSGQLTKGDLAFHTSNYHAHQDYTKSVWDECQDRIRRAKECGIEHVECSPFLNNEQLYSLRESGHKWQYAGRLDENGEPDSPQESWVDVSVNGSE